jgi:hypothetical protein
MADKIKKIKKSPIYDKLHPELKDNVTEVLKSVAQDISDGKYGYNTILDEILEEGEKKDELKSMKKILASYQDLPEDTKKNIRKHMKNSI